jgi:hypothetical protein
MANVGLGLVLASYLFGLYALFSPGIEELSDRAEQLLVWGVAVTAVLNTLAIVAGLVARKGAAAESSTRSKAGWAIGLGIFGYLGTVVLAISIVGGALARVGR